MAEYLIGYYGGNNPASPEEGQAHRVKWMEWIQSLGDKVVNPGQPLMNSQQIGPGVDVVLKGFAVVKADSMEEAMEIAHADPFLSLGGGTIQVAEMMKMPG